jgi:hypothetical protein
VGAYDADTGASLGSLAEVPLQNHRVVRLDAPVPLPETQIETWAFYYGPNGTATRPWDANLGWLSTRISNEAVLDACAYDDRTDANGLVYTDFARGRVNALEFDAEGHLLSTWTLYGIDGASGRAISSFARTAPGGIPGREVLVVTHGSPGQLWQVDPAAPGDPVLVGPVGNDPRQIRAAGDLAVVTSFESDAITIVRWPAGGMASVVGTVPVGDGPVGVGMRVLPSGNVLVATTGFHDDTVTLTMLSPSGTVLSNETRPAPQGCAAPGFAFFIEGMPLELVLTCHDSSNIHIIPLDFE